MTRKSAAHSHIISDLAQLLLQESPPLNGTIDNKVTVPTLANVLEKDLRQSALAVLRLTVREVTAIEYSSYLVYKNHRIIWSVDYILDRMQRKNSCILREILQLQISYYSNFRIPLTYVICVTHHAAGFPGAELTKIDM